MSTRRIFASPRTVLSNSRGGFDLPSLLVGFAVVGLLMSVVMGALFGFSESGGEDSADLSALVNTAAVAGLALVAGGIGYGCYRLWKKVLQRYPAEESKLGSFSKK